MARKRKKISFTFYFSIYFLLALCTSSFCTNEVVFYLCPQQQNKRSNITYIIPLLSVLLWGSVKTHRQAPYTVYIKCFCKYKFLCFIQSLLILMCEGLNHSLSQICACFPHYTAVINVKRSYNVKTGRMKMEKGR